MLLGENSDIFGTQGELNPYVEHAFNTEDHPPFSRPPYRVSSARKEQLKSDLDKLLGDHIIEETEST